MRVWAACLLALGFLAGSTAMAAGDPNNNAAAGNATTSASSDPGKAAPATAAKAEPAPTSAEIAVELQSLRELVEQQSKQLQNQQDKVQDLEHQLKVERAARESLAAASPGGEPAAAHAAYEPAVSAALAPSNQEKNAPPTAITFKGVTLTPGGFFAAESVWRQHALSADVNTPLNSIPMPGATQSRVSEFNASGRQSRISMLAEGKLDTVKLSGYYETDFLSGGTTSNNNQSNSYTMRQRQFWGQAKFNNGWSFTGGQMWSLVTETTKGLDNRTEILPMTIDAQYHVGFSWTRQFGARFVKDFGDKVWLGFSIESPQTLFTVHGNPTAQAAGGGTACTNAGCTTTVAVPNPNPVFTNFLIGASGTGGGLMNPLGNYSYNLAPDLVFKAAFEPGFGHYEVFGIVSQFRDRIFPCVVNSGTLTGCGGSATSAFGAYNYSTAGGGGGANARWNLFDKHVDLGLHFLAGNGVGRYGTSTLPDATIRPDGTIALITSYQWLGTLQLHPTPKLDIYLNAGQELAGRTEFAKTSGGAFNEGYGAVTFNNSGCWTETLPSTSTPAGTAAGSGYIPGGLSNCTADTRNIIEGTLGFWYRFYKGPKGTAQFGTQYSYVVRNTWSGVGSAAHPNGQPAGTESMAFTSFRYYLP